MANKIFGVDMPPATLPLSGSETLSVMQGGILSDCTVQDIANKAPAGTGDVSGPSSSVNNRIVLFDGTTGKLIKDSGQTIPQVQRKTVTALAIASGVVNINCALGDYFTLSLTANVTSITFSNLPGAGLGASLAIRIIQDATGGRTVSLPSSFKAITGSDTSVQSAANSYTIVHIETFDNGTSWEYSMKAGAP